MIALFIIYAIFGPVFLLVFISERFFARFRREE